MDPEKASPTANRIEALDFVRGVALCGILLMNITAFGLPHAYTNPRNYGGAEGANLWAWLVTQVGFEGTQRALFSILFGAGVVLFTARLEAAGRSDAADIYFKRNLWLMAFGLVDAFFFLWYGDILFTYGATALFLYAFRRLPVKWLLGLGVAGLVIGAVWNLSDTFSMLSAYRGAEAAKAEQALGKPLNEKQKAAIDAWTEAEGDYVASQTSLQKDLKETKGGYASAFLRAARLNVYWQSTGLYRYFFDVFAPMLIGMALLKLGVLTLERPTRLYVAMAVIGYGIGLAVNVAEARHILGHDFSAIAFSEANISYDLGRLTMTMGHLGALLLFVRSGVLPWLRHGFAAIGKMALTSYLTHSIVCAILFVGFGLYGELQRFELYYIVFAIWAAQLAVSPLWLRHFRFGPAEWLWRALTYEQWPEMRLAPKTVPA